jgi:hypothetical protein
MTLMKLAATGPVVILDKLTDLEPLVEDLLERIDSGQDANDGDDDASTIFY